MSVLNGCLLDPLKKTSWQSIDGALCSLGEVKNQIEIAELVKVAGSSCVFFEKSMNTQTSHMT